jgi:hypothetical protein
VPRSISGTHARACAAFAPRFACVRVAPFGLPVVPLVYWMRATSSAPGATMWASTGADATSSRHGVVPRTFVVSAARDSLAFAIGNRSRARVRNGIARVTSTDTIDCTATSAGNAWIVSTTLSQAITTRAP